MMWVMAGALTFIREFQSQAQAAGWDLYLGGEVLLAGDSNQRLDILAMPRPTNYEHSVREFVHDMQMRGLEYIEQIRVPNRMIVRMHMNLRDIEVTFINFSDDYEPMFPMVQSRDSLLRWNWRELVTPPQIAPQVPLTAHLGQDLGERFAATEAMREQNYRDGRA